MARFGFNTGLDGRRAHPLSEHDAEAVAESLKLIYEQGRTRMLKNVASRMARGITQYGWAERKAGEVLDAHQQLAKILDDCAKGRQKLLGNVIADAYATGNVKFHSDMRSILGNVAHISPNALKAGYILSDLNDALQAAERRILRQFDDRYADIIGYVSSQMATGTMNTRQAVGEALQKFADEGITGFVDRGGHHWTLENYSEMAVLTAIERSTVAGYVDTMQGYGYDLAIIDGHIGACPICEAWESVIVSVSGDNPKYPSLDEAESAGCFHPRCMHGISCYHEDVSHAPADGFRSEPRPMRQPSVSYTARSKMRYMERMIRKYKDRALVAYLPSQRAQALHKVKEWEDALDDLIASQPEDDHMYRHRGRETATVSSGSMIKSRSVTDSDGNTWYEHETTEAIQNAESFDELTRHFWYEDQYGRLMPVLNDNLANADMDILKELSEGVEWAKKTYGLEHDMPKTIRFGNVKGLAEYNRITREITISPGISLEDAFLTAVHEMTHFNDDRLGVASKGILNDALHNLGIEPESKTAISYQFGIVNYNPKTFKDPMELLANSIEMSIINDRNNELANEIVSLWFERVKR